MKHDVGDVLLKAASIVEEGWARERSVVVDRTNHVFAHCALGAIWAAGAELVLGERPATRVDHFGVRSNPDVKSLVDQVCGYMTAKLHRTVWSWNDNLCSSGDEVATHLREAAMSWRG